MTGIYSVIIKHVNNFIILRPKSYKTMCITYDTLLDSEKGSRLKLYHDPQIPNIYHEILRNGQGLHWIS